MHSTSIIRLSVLLLILASMLTLPAKPVQAANQIVTSCNETGFTNALSAIQSEQAAEGTISFQCGAGTGLIELTTPKLIVGRITIDGGAAIIISGQRATQLFEVQADASLLLSNIILEKGGSSTLNGGSIQVNQNASLSVLKSTIRQSRSAGSGGAIHSYLGSVWIESSILEDNEAAYGGAIAQNGGTLVLSDTQMLRNSATAGDGGGLQSWNANTTIRLSNFDSNTAPADNGGAVSLRGGTSSIRGGSFSANSALNGAGIMAWDGAQITLSYATLAQNTATQDGGALKATDDSKLSLDHLIVQGNKAYTGGGIFQSTGQASISDSAFLLNQSTSGPGGAIIFGPGSFDIQRSIFLSNKAVNNAGGAIHSGGTLKLTNVHLEQNSAASNGGGLRLIGSTTTLINTTIYNNSGSGISTRFVLNGSVVLQNSILARNTPANCDGGLDNGNHSYSFSDDASCTKLNSGTNKSPVALAFEAINVNFAVSAIPIGTPLRSATSVDSIPASACPGIDLRGIARPQGTACDAGAIERQGLLSTKYIYLAFIGR